MGTCHPATDALANGPNSIATGTMPDRHGILGFMEVDEDRGEVRPSTSLSRRVKAIWNILSQEGYRTHVVNWFCSHPAEPINGISISEMFSAGAQRRGWRGHYAWRDCASRQLTEKLSDFLVTPMRSIPR